MAGSIEDSFLLGEAVQQRKHPAKLVCAVPCCVNRVCRHRNETPISGPLRPPALVTEYLASGSLRAAIARQAEFILKSNTVKCKLALDAARVSLGALGRILLCSLLGQKQPGAVGCLHGYAQLTSAGGYLLAQDANALCLNHLCLVCCPLHLRCLVLPSTKTQGMEYLHAKNIVHFDLKTANLLVGMRVSQDSQSIGQAGGVDGASRCGGTKGRVAQAQPTPARQTCINRTRSCLLLWLCVSLSLCGVCVSAPSGQDPHLQGGRLWPVQAEAADLRHRRCHAAWHATLVSCPWG